jgi:hypothetical protein
MWIVTTPGTTLQLNALAASASLTCCRSAAVPPSNT